MIFPKLETRLYFLAIFPSSISVNDAAIKMISAIIKYPVRYAAMKNGTAIIRQTVSLFGKFILNLPALQIIVKGL